MNVYRVAFMAVFAASIVLTGCGGGRLLSKDDVRQTEQLAHSLITALQTNNYRALQSISVPGQWLNKQTALSSRSADASYGDYWRRTLLSDNPTVTPKLFTAIKSYPGEIVRGYIMMHITDASKAKYDSYAIVKFRYSTTKPEALIPLLKIKGKWLVLDMPTANTRLLRFKTMIDAYNCPNKDWEVREDFTKEMRRIFKPDDQMLRGDR
ncbi:MAG: hypothetical protein ACYC1M_13490 [Armatimonadota bacterium]